MSAALIMEPHTQEEGGDTAHARRAQNILKQKVVSDLLKDHVETEDFSEQVFLPEETSWRVQSITPDSGTDISITIPGLIISWFADVFCYEREISDYKEMMFNKDHKNWVGTDSDSNPVVISVHTDTDNLTIQIILRDVRETKSEKFDNNEECVDVDSVLNLAKRVSPQLEIDNLKEIECEDIKVKQRRNNRNVKNYFSSIRNGSQSTMKTTMNYCSERITQSECSIRSQKSPQRVKYLVTSGTARNLYIF